MAEYLQAAVGDTLLLTFTQGSHRLRVSRVPKSTIENEEGVRKVAMPMGIRPRADENGTTNLIAEAIGAASEDDVETRLRIRGEDSLADEFSTESAGDLDDAIERLRGVL